MGKHANFVVMHAPPFRGSKCEGVEFEWARKFARGRRPTRLCGDGEEPDTRSRVTVRRQRPHKTEEERPLVCPKGDLSLRLTSTTRTRTTSL